MADTLDDLKTAAISGNTAPLIAATTYGTTPVATEAPASGAASAVGASGANTTGTPTAGTPNATGSLMDIAKAIMGTGTAKGAALGALFTELLKQSNAGEGALKPMDMSKYSIPSRSTTFATPKFVPYSEYGTRDVPALSNEAMKSFGIPSGLGSLMPVSSYSGKPSRASALPVTVSSVGSGRNVMPSLDITPRSNQPISPLTGALLGGALGYLITPESAASRAGASAVGQLYDIAGGAVGDISGAIADFFKKRSTIPSGNVGPNVPTGSRGEAYYQQDGKTYAINTDGTTRLVYDPKTGGGSAGGYDPSQFGGTQPTYTLPSDFKPNIPYTYTPTLSGGTQTGSYYNTPSYTPPTSTYTPSFSSGTLYGDYYKDGGMATPLMADGGMAFDGMGFENEMPLDNEFIFDEQALPDEQPRNFYTYGTIVDPMQFLIDAQEYGMAQGGKPQGGLHVPTIEGRHDYRAGARVMGPGDGQSDDIPAMLADGEYVIDAETVAQLGNGSSKAGSDMLDKFREEIRSHKRSAPVNKIPPASKSPLQYLKQAQSRSKKNG